MVVHSFAAAIVLAASTFVSFEESSFGHEPSHQPLKTVHFPTSCNETAQALFDHAMAYQHAFLYVPAGKLFREAAEADSECAIAYWGIALSLLYNLRNPPPASNLQLGLTAIQTGKAIGTKTRRERDYLETLRIFYADYDTAPHSARMQAYLEAAEALARQYPDDAEAQVTYAMVSRATCTPLQNHHGRQFLQNVSCAQMHVDAGLKRQAFR